VGGGGGREEELVEEVFVIFPKLFGVLSDHLDEGGLGDEDGGIEDVDKGG
jgi:hypothetical protein